MNPHILIIGAITHSKALYKDGIHERFGGGIIYGGFTSLRMGNKTSIITIGADDIKPGVQNLQTKGAIVHHIKRPQSNNFSNDYTVSPRLLQMRSYIKKPLTIQEISCISIKPQGVIFIPLYYEITPELINYYSDYPTLLDVQGLTRTLSKTKNKNGCYTVSQAHWKDINLYSGKISILRLSDDDMRSIKFPNGVKSHKDKLRYFIKIGFPIVVLTRGHKSTLIAKHNAKALDLPVFPTEIKDTAGAGDAFNVGFMNAYLKTKDVKYSGLFGNAVASFHIARISFNYSKIDRFLKNNY